jgi:hypothetical protein
MDHCLQNPSPALAWALLTSLNDREHSREETHAIRPEGGTTTMRSTIMRKMALPFGAAVLAIMASGPSVAQAAQARCFYKGAIFSDGAMSCQSGAQFRCKDGDWKSTGFACSDEKLTLARTCELNGISYPTGAASCKSGTQYRCEDGQWASLMLPCTVGDSPIRALPSGRTCLYEGATVSTNSTICKGGTTFLCSDGEWTNVGTQCR